MKKQLKTLISLHNQGITPDVITLAAIDMTFSLTKKDWRYECAELINHYFATCIVGPLVDSISKEDL